MLNQANRSRTLKTTADPQEAGHEAIFWAIEDILELGLNRNEAAALRRIIAMGAQAFYESLGEQGLHLLARRRTGLHPRVHVPITPTQAIASRPRLDDASSPHAKLRPVYAQRSGEEANVPALPVGAARTQNTSSKVTAENPFSDMRGLAISRNTVSRA